MMLIKLILPSILLLVVFMVAVLVIAFIGHRLKVGQ